MSDPVSEFSRALRLIVLTDRALAEPRPVLEVVQAALAAGAPSIQLRDKNRPARDTVALGRELRTLTAEAGALLWVNDRADIAESIDADGVHVGPGDPPVSELRRVYGDRLSIGASTDDPDRARQLEDAGADYLGCGAVYGTTTKDVGDGAIGLVAFAAVANRVRIPVVAIGGVTPDKVPALRAAGAAGVAAVAAVMAANDSGAAVARFLAPWAGPTREDPKIDSGA